MAILYDEGASGFDIRALEKKYSINFPGDYKHFLSTSNGLVVEYPDFCELPCDAVDNKTIAFYSLFGLKVSNKNSEVDFQNENLLNEIAFISNAFIIGDDPGGNYFVLVCNDFKQDIYYWDRTHLHAEDESENFTIREVNESGHLYKIYDNFSDFLLFITKNISDY